MAPKHILLLGGHGKISLLMTPLLLRQGWHVTSVIRDADQKGDIVAAAGKEGGGSGSGKLEVLVRSLEDVKSEGDAKGIVELVGADTVVWSAGAGGKGGSSRTYAVDRDAAQHFAAAALALPAVTTFLLVSALSIRRHKAPWWTDEDWERISVMNRDVMPHYYRAKLAADEFLSVGAAKREGAKGDGERGFRHLILRPAGLEDGNAEGKISFGKTRGWGMVRRADVAATAVELLRVGSGSGWFDLVKGEVEVEEAVRKAAEEGVNAMDGESLKEMEKIVRA